MVRKSFWLIILFILLPGPALAGNIKGVAVFTGEDTVPKVLKTGKYKKACGPEIPNEIIIVENKGLRNVVVTVEGNDLGGKPGQSILDQKKCRYEPHVTALMKGSELIIHSSDPINHNIHTYSFENDPINSMFVPGQEDETIELEEPEVIKIECDLHHWMTAWIVVTENSFFSISGKNGEYKIPDLPPGKYTLTAWHESLGIMSQTVTVGDGETQLNFDFSNSRPAVTQK